MIRKLALLALLATLPLTGCKKVKAFIEKKAAATPPPVAAATPAPEPTAADVPATPPPKPRVSVNKNAVAIALCYHNIEDQSKMKALTISVAEFEHEMQAIKDNGFTVIPMQDFFAWRRGEKDIPAKSAIISIDDGWISGYQNAWPILKKYGYPFTMFIYINYVGSGGKSLSWEQLAEMRDAGVDIESHTYSHSSLKAPGALVDRKTADMVRKDVAALGMDGWLRKEIIDSKKVLEKQLGIKVNAIAYPFGKYSERAVEIVKEAGYEGAFTVYGQQLRSGSPPAELLGRYAVEASKPQIFQDAMKMIGGGVVGTPAAEPNFAQLASASMITQPMEGEVVTVPKPLIKANLATFGDVDASSVEMRVSGLGRVVAKYDSASKNVEYQVPQPLTDADYTVFISAMADGKRVETKWSFKYGPGASAAPAPSTVPAAPEAAPGKHHKKH